MTMWRLVTRLDGRVLWVNLAHAVCIREDDGKACTVIELATAKRPEDPRPVSSAYDPSFDYVREAATVVARGLDWPLLTTIHGSRLWVNPTLVRRVLRSHRAPGQARLEMVGRFEVVRETAEAVADQLVAAGVSTRNAA